MHSTYFLWKPKVNNFEVTLPVYEEVLGLEVPVHNVEVVQVLQTANYLRRVEQSGAWAEPARAPEITGELNN